MRVQCIICLCVRLFVCWFVCSYVFVWTPCFHNLPKTSYVHPLFVGLFVYLFVCVFVCTLCLHMFLNRIILDMQSYESKPSSNSGESVRL